MRDQYGDKAFLGTAAAVVALLAAGCYYMPGQRRRDGKGCRHWREGTRDPGQLELRRAGGDRTWNGANYRHRLYDCQQHHGVGPAGPARTFTLLLNSPSATLEGVATVDLQAGQSTTVNVTPTLGATQIVIPDETNDQIVQISDMTGTGLTTINAASFSRTVNPTLRPFNRMPSISTILEGSILPTIPVRFGGLLRIDDINHRKLHQGRRGDSTTGITTVAVDRRTASSTTARRAQFST